MIKSDFASVFRAKSIAAFQRQFHFGVETLDDSAGILLGGLEIVEKKTSVGLEGAGNFLERIQARAGDLFTPCVKEFSGPSRRAIRPEVSEGFDQKKGPQGAQSRALNFSHAAALPLGPVASSFQERPAHFFEQGFEAGLDTRTGFLASDFIDCVIEFFDDVEGVEDLKCVGQVSGGRLDVGLPHVRADEADALAELGAENLEEEVEGLLGAVGADPQEPLAVVVDLIDQRPELVLLAHMDLVHTESLDAGKIAVLDAVFHDPFDGPIHVGPTGAEASGNLRPGKQASPLGKEEPEHIADLVLAGGPRNPLNGRPALAAVDAPECIDQKNDHAPEGNEVPLAFRLPIISRPLLSATRTNPPTALALGNLHPKCFRADRIPRHGLIDKALDRVNFSQYGFQRYVTHNGWFIGALPGSASLTFSTLAAGKPQQVSPRTPAAASGAGLGGAQPPSNRFVFTHRFFCRARKANH